MIGDTPTLLENGGYPVRLVQQFISNRAGNIAQGDKAGREDVGATESGVLESIVPHKVNL
jgi:hypothetical protein